jgi:uncharacterized SAM-binding protein YcdF (DUF218 family)
MFEKKYVFETKSTRHKRILFNSFVAFIGMLISFATLSVYLPIYAKNQKEITSQALYQKAPDVIAVFTGDSGRIAYALELAKTFPSAKIFITGVYAKNSLETLIKSQTNELVSVDEFLNKLSHHVDLDYLARNTVENGIATLNYLRQHPEHKRVLVVTSDYHVLRSKLILNTLVEDEEQVSFYYEGIARDYTQVRSIKILLKEVYKLFKTSSFLLFWDPNDN